MARRILSQWAVWFTWFGLALLLSIAYHLPAAYVQTWFETSPNARWQASQTQGTVWQGQTQLHTVHSVNQPLTHIGTLNWQMIPSRLMLGNFAVRGHVQMAQPSLQSNAQPNAQSRLQPLQVDLTLPLTMVLKPQNAENVRRYLEIEALNGQIELTALLNHLNALGVNVALTQGAVHGGVLDFKQMAGHVDLVHLWPTEWGGQLKIVQLKLLGSVMPEVSITPSVQDNKVILSLASAQANAWSLVGTLVLNRNQADANKESKTGANTHAIDYQIKLTLTAQSAEQMPEWVSFMNLKSPTVAELNAQGVL